MAAQEDLPKVKSLEEQQIWLQLTLNFQPETEVIWDILSNLGWLVLFLSFQWIIHCFISVQSFLFLLITGNGLGIRVVGGKEIPGSMGEIGAYIAKILPGGNAEQTGKLIEGKKNALLKNGAMGLLGVC